MLSPIRLLATSLLAVFVSCTPTMTSSRDDAPKTSSPSAPANSAPIARRSGHATASDGARIYYEVCGSGPAMVFVHGLGGNHAVWFQQVAHFAASHTVITMSQRGFAPSGGNQERYDVKLLVRDLEAVMDSAGITRAVVIGQSMGGWTALGIALESPQRVDALVLADTLGGIHDDEIAVQLRAIGESAARLRKEPPPLGVHPALSASFSRRRPDLGYLYQALTTFGAPAPDSIVRQLFAARVTPAELGELRMPTLFIVGSEDTLFPPALLQKAATYIAGAEVKVIDDAGHSPYFEQPAAWNEAVANFLSRR
ncbi:MAG: alpha/beta fold hydrolase [Candidatus Binatia bacterium]